MPRKSIPVLVAAGLLLSVYAAHAFSLGLEGRIFSKLGASVKKGSGGGSCTNKLDFSQSCNSQYIAVIH